MCRAAKRSAAVKWLAPKPIVGRPAHLEPEARVVGQRQPPRVDVMAVLLREDVGHVLLRDGALEAADDGGGEPVGVASHGPRAVPGEPLEAGPEGEPDPDARHVAEPRRELDDVLDQELARIEQPVAVTVRDEPVGPVDELDRAAPSARTESRPSSSRSRPSSSQRRRTPLCRARQLSAGRRCRSAARQSCSCGPTARTFRPPSAELAQHARGPGRRPRGRGRPRRRRPRSACTARPRRVVRRAAGTAARAAARRPRARPAPTRLRPRRKKRKVTNRSPSASAAGRA